MDTSGQQVLITGGGSGIGFHLAKSFVTAGSSVVIVGRNEAKLEAACKSLGDGSEYAVCDVGDTEQVKGLADKFASRINVLVNNAGVARQVSYAQEKVDLDQQFREVEIDFNGPLRMVHFFLSSLKEQPEAGIVNVSSALAYVPLHVLPVYCAMKAAMHSWTQSLRFQLKDTQVKVFELLPPLVKTDMVKSFKGVPMMLPEVLAENFMRDFADDTYESNPGQSGQMKVMSRWAPGFLYGFLNRRFTFS